MTDRRVGLDYVRAAAIALVVVCHLFTFYGRYKGSVYPLGFAGVELFFVLSGFLVGGIFLRQIVREQRVTLPLMRRFWIRRWLRTVPSYLLFIPVYSWLELRIPPHEWPMYLTFTQNFAWPLRGGFGISWSLTIEEWFYLLLPILTLLAAGVMYVMRAERSVDRVRRAFLVTAVVLIVAPLVLRLAFGVEQLWDKEVRKVVVYRLDAILIGALIAYIRQFRPVLFERLQRPSAFAAGLLIAGGAYAYLHWRYVATGLPDFAATHVDMIVLFNAMDIGCALMLPAAFAFRGGPAWLDRPIVWLSLWSYALYLCHRPVMMFLGRRVRSLEFDAFTIPPWVAGLLTMLIVAAAVHYLFEAPIMRLRDRFFPDRAALSGKELEKGEVASVPGQAVTTPAPITPP